MKKGYRFIGGISGMKMYLFFLPITLAMIVTRLVALIRPIKRMMVAYLRMIHEVSELLEREISEEYGVSPELRRDLEYEIAKVEHLHNKIKLLQYMFGIKKSDYLVMEIESLLEDTKKPLN